MKVDNLVPNLDAMSANELMDFWFKHQSGRGHPELFPGRGKGVVTATHNLASYASNKATAMQCRIRGEIESAMMYEGICDRIYAKLPDFARW
jgi:hypothetical protein